MDDQNQGGEPQAPSNVVINGQEYTPEEAQQLIDTGRKTREYEQKWNTPLDKVWPEYSRLSQERSSWQTEKQKLEAQIQEFQSKQQQGTETEDDVTKAKEAARKLGLTLKEDLEKEGYIRKDDLPKYFQQFSAEQQAVQKVLDEATKLEKEIDGSDGRPKFNKRVVLAYAQAYGHEDLMKAYEDMHGDSLKTWKEAQVNASKKPGLKTLKPSGGAKEPRETKVDDNNFKSLLKEQLWGSEQ